MTLNMFANEKTMKLSYISTDNRTEIAPNNHWRQAFHQAGHAAALYLNAPDKNKLTASLTVNLALKKPVTGKKSQVTECHYVNHLAYQTRNKHTLLPAFTADIVALIAGPLAEARYTLTQDNEIFHINLLKPDALQNYGGQDDLMLIEQCLDNFFILHADTVDREQTLLSLYKQAFGFVQNEGNWQRISALAHYLGDSQNQPVDIAEITAVLDQHYRYVS